MKRIISTIILFNCSFAIVAMDQDQKPLLTQQSSITSEENVEKQKAQNIIKEINDILTHPETPYSQIDLVHEKLAQLIKETKDQNLQKLCSLLAIQLILLPTNTPSQNNPCIQKQIGHQLIRNSALDILGKPGTRPYQLGLTYEMLAQLFKQNKKPDLDKLVYLIILRHVSPDAVYEDTNKDSVPCSYQQNIRKDDNIGGCYFLPLCYNESWQNKINMEEIMKKVKQEAQEANCDDPFFIKKRIITYTGGMNAPLKHEKGIYNVIQHKELSQFEENNPEPTLTENLKAFCSAISDGNIVFNTITEDVNKVLTTNEKDLGFTPVIEKKQFTQEELTLLVNNLPRGLQHLKKFDTYLNKQKTSGDHVITLQKKLVKALVPIYTTTLEKVKKL